MIKKLVMLLSGKGGVGKTICAINLAYGLTDAGKKVALIDADLSNPNCAELLGIEEQIRLSEEQEFLPLIHDGFEFFSMANICGNRPVSMESSMYAQILRDVLQQKLWTSEFGVVDMSAGVSDTFLEIVNVFGENLLGSVIVYLPAHLYSARKLLTLHKNEGIPVIGLIENMNRFICPECKKVHHIFGSGSLKSLAKEFEVEPLGSIPLSMEIRNAVEKGKPILPPTLNKPLKKTVERVLEAKPVGVAFAERIKEKLKGIARRFLDYAFAKIVDISNTEVNLPEIQRRYAFPGGRVIELDITDENLRRVRRQLFFRLENGVFKVVKNPKEVHDEVRVWDKAFIWAILGRRTDTGVEYDLMDAWLSGKAKYYSFEAGTQRALRLMRDVWGEVRDAEGFVKLRPVLERIV